jgi:cysteinyl-tRNA synthetase
LFSSSLLLILLSFVKEIMTEDVDSAAKLSARALAQKEYKKGKKKRAKVKQTGKKKKEQGLLLVGLENENKEAAEQQRQQPAPTKWCREFDCPKSTNRPVDDDKINKLLDKRSKAKAEKNYTVSDEITCTLIDMEIVYNDEKRQWHTRQLLTVAQKQAKKEQAKKRASENNKDDATEEPATKKLKNTKK